MSKLLPFAGIALALALGTATASAAPGNAGLGPQGQHQTFSNQHHGTPPKQAAKPPIAKAPAAVRNNNDGWNNKGPQIAKPDFNRFRGNFKAPKRFKAAAYHAPRGYSYHRVSFGQRLPFAFLAQNFRLANTMFYGLVAPPSGLIWVRYGSDALLVNQSTGEIVQVRSGLFY